MQGPLENSLTFPDFPLTFYSFPYPLTVKKIIFILYLVVLTVPQGGKFFSLRVAPNAEVDGLRLSHENVILSPLEQNN